MKSENTLLPAESAEIIAGLSKYVSLDEVCIEKLSDQMLSTFNLNKLDIPDIGVKIDYPAKDDPRAIDWMFVVDSLNFCFWSLPGTDKWTVEGYVGYCALEAALSRALKEGHEITNPNFYSKITMEQLKHIMRSDNDTQIPLINERLAILLEIGGILLEKFNGTFETCLKLADKSATKLLSIIVDNFPCYRDESVYKGYKVSFYKRAQILVADIWNFFGGDSWGEFDDIDKITMFADYRVPQVLLYFGVMSYTDELMEKVKNDVLLEIGSEEENEIRGCSIHAVELLKKTITEKAKDRPDIQVPISSLIDYYLWCYRRKHAEELEKVPFHKTIGIYY